MCRIPTWTACSTRYRNTVAIDLEIFGQLLQGQPRRRTLEMPDGSTARDAASTIGLEFKEIGLITIDGIQSRLDDPLRPGCRLCFFPYLAGG